jgi:hypothetical protein
MKNFCLFLQKRLKKFIFFGKITIFYESINRGGNTKGKILLGEYPKFWYNSIAMQIIIILQKRKITKNERRQKNG